ncbi:helix-turn-helix domain-containing protein [Thermomonospora cellulosilytica]|uniref:Transcriptional regulator with XRE-family HTH domain n=1 Tax=Thermomonospora cellulosilytica TaxID=1411118 RepID=A0A7W3MUV0_9ACTN|nr:helix-turn-helix transcriptional regulator [Thermomonospora cellulosilytica]MBA9002299.1 transcriptional regulator with XRE-family HTH domain [Thermomonospora cellulosilytica]
MPIVRDPLDPKVSMWHFLAYYLRFMREREGLSLTQWGRIIGAARSTVSNIEAGRHRLQEDHAKIIDARFGTGRLIELLLWYARSAHDPDWFRQFTHYEKQATALKIYHGEMIPFPFQTDEYTWEQVREGDYRDMESEQEARLRRKRHLLDREDSPFLWALIHESALATQVGGPELMRKQIQHLREMADLPRIVVRIIPFTAGAHLGTDGPFQIISLESRDIAYAGAQNGGRLVEGPGEVREFAFKFDRIGAKAASEDDSRKLIEQWLERYP